MPEPVDLANYQFWSALAVGLVVLTPLTHPTARKVCWTALNLMFLAMLLGPKVAVVMAGLAVVTALTRGRGAFVVVAGSLALFVVHKTTPNPLLTAIGFSYIFLRALDMARAVYEGRQKAPGVCECVNYLVPFHMLAAGPIQSYDDFCRQPPVPAAPTSEDVLQGVERIAHGLFKKVILAQTLEKLFLTGFSGGDAGYWLFEAQIYYLWVYLDFSAYSDIAVGTGRLLGLHTPENFRNPLLARDIIDFWERWHISLSRFIRFNLFIPVQMTLARRTRNRSPLVIGAVAYLVSFGLCGLWHGLDSKFLVWGLYHALGLIVCKTYQDWMLQRYGRKGRKAYLANFPIRVLMTAITFEFVAISLAIIA